MKNRQKSYFLSRYYPQKVKSDDYRAAYTRDKGRVIHSFAFRCLQNKTQVLAPHKGDFHRTRLTHSLEAAQIGEGIVESIYHRYKEQPELNMEMKRELRLWLLPKQKDLIKDLIATACYCHDLGHPPFGHAGEFALHNSIVSFSAHDNIDEKIVKMHGGFESNAHTLRIITRLEPYLLSKNQGGINPTRRTILAVLKYPLSYRQFDNTYKGKECTPPKCYFESEAPFVQWAADLFGPEDRARYLALSNRAVKKGGNIKEIAYPTVDATIMDLADEIAYSTHDVEDAIFHTHITKDDINECKQNALQGIDREHARIIEAILTKEHIDSLCASHAQRKRAISTLIHSFITASKIEKREGFSHPLLKYRVVLPAAHASLLNSLRVMVREKIIDHPTQQRAEARGRKMIADLFNVYHRDGKRIMPAWDQLLQSNIETIGNEQMAVLRTITDYLAGMSDMYLIRTHQELSP